MSVGYTTLYGDLAGGFAVIKDVFKTLVYSLCAWRNSPAAVVAPVVGPPQHRPVASPIPSSIIERAPSRSSGPDQRDEDSLPPYDVLTGSSRATLELDQSREQLIARGCPRLRSTARYGSSTTRSTSAARRRRASRSARVPSAAIAACRSRTATAD